jgi:pyruvate/2-oxoglutarate dehydrogenase complex dihydrolipoamide dehydrogenase (E3) component
VEEGGSEETVGADLVILARGSMPEPTWLELLRRKVPEVHAVGDCVEPRIIADALYEGAWAGSRI